jgi:AmmeMemoRadiSam system protein B
MPERPQLRPYLDFTQEVRQPKHFLLRDRRGFSPGSCRISQREFSWLRLFDGQRTLRDIQAEAMRQSGGELLPLDAISGLVEKLDEGFFLDSARFRTRLAEPIRQPSCIGCYEGDPKALHRQLAGLFAEPRGPGLPRLQAPDGKIRAALLPHIDYRRGGHSFAWGFKEIVEHTGASLFVIVGTSHHSRHRFTLTRKDFKTPLGIARTDQAYIDCLVAHYGNGLFEDEVAHLPEHSIELEVVFLQYLYDGRRPFRIVPLVVGSFQDCIETGTEPRRQTDIGRMVEALRRVEAETPEPICYLISGDLAHIGPEFGDRELVNEPQLKASRQQDLKLCQAAAGMDVRRYFDIIADESDSRRICGLPPTYTVLAALQPRRGRLLQYDQYVHPRGAQSVSFATVAFYR